MHDSSFPTAGQVGLSHDRPDPLVVDFPASTHQGFADTTIAVAGKRFTHLSDGLTKLLIVLLVRRWAAMLLVPRSADPQRATQPADGQLRHLLPKPLN